MSGANQYQVTINGGTPKQVTEPKYAASGLTAATKYTWTVVAQDTTGAAQDSPASTPAEFTTKETPEQQEVSAARASAVRRRTRTAE